MSDDNDWLDTLIALGIGALAAYFLLKKLSSDGEAQERIEVCPYCGRQIRKWAIKCPYCRSDLPRRARYQY